VFPQIYGCCEQQNGLVAEVVLANGLDLTFCRSFGPVEVREWSELGNMMNGLVLNEEEDKVKWAFEASGKFSTKSMYRFILNPGVRDVRMMDMWSVIELSIKIKKTSCGFALEGTFKQLCN
jgi:hypothetical protein